MSLAPALLAFVLAAPAGGVSPCANVPPGSKTASAACILHRVQILRDAKPMFLKIAGEGVPPGLPPTETQEARRWLKWIEAWAWKLGTLAELGERSVGHTNPGALGKSSQATNQIGAGGAIGGSQGGVGGAIGDASGGSGQDQLLAATKQMQETQMSFNLQYLQLQSQMQNENRSYTAVSNIMKTKHDTVKNSISNIR
jgi:hypothetical protein